MQRLTIYLKKVVPENNKIKNTVSYKVKTSAEVNSRLSEHENNILKFQISNYKR